MLTYDKKLSEIRAKMGDYSECLSMLLNKMPEFGGCIPLTERIMATHLNPKREIDKTKIMFIQMRGGEHFATVEDEKWYGFDLEHGMFYIHNNNDKFYYLSI